MAFYALNVHSEVGGGSATKRGRFPPLLADEGAVLFAEIVRLPTGGQATEEDALPPFSSRLLAERRQKSWSIYFCRMRRAASTPRT